MMNRERVATYAQIMIIALFASAASDAWYATIPSDEELLVIYASWGVIGVGILWAAMFKQVRLLGSGDQQGRMFGSLEGARGLFEAILLTVGSFIFGLFATRELGMINVIILCTVCSVTLGAVLMHGRPNGQPFANIVAVSAGGMVASSVLYCLTLRHSSGVKL